MSNFEFTQIFIQLSKDLIKNVNYIINSIYLSQLIDAIYLRFLQFIIRYFNKNIEILNKIVFKIVFQFQYIDPKI